MAVVMMPKPRVQRKQLQQRQLRAPQRVSVFSINDEAISPKLVREIFSRYGRVGRIDIGCSPEDAEQSPWVYFELHDGSLDDQQKVVWNGKELRLEIR